MKTVPNLKYTTENVLTREILSARNATKHSLALRRKASKATPSPRSSSPNSPSTRIFSKSFQTKYPEAVQEHIQRFVK